MLSLFKNTGFDEKTQFKKDWKKHLYSNRLKEELLFKENNKMNRSNFFIYNSKTLNS